MITEKEKEEIIKDFKPVIDQLLELLWGNKKYADKIRLLDFVTGLQYVYNDKNEPVDEIIHRFISMNLKEEEGKSVFSGEKLIFSY